MPTRRAVLAAAGLSLFGGHLAGCGIRVEAGAPPLPLVPPRGVDERAVAIWRELRWIGAAREAAAATVSRRLATQAAALSVVHGRQVGVLLARLRELAEDPDDTARLDEAAGGAHPRPSPLAAAEAGGLRPADLATLGEWPTDEVPLLLSLRVQRAVALPWLGARPAPATAPVCASDQEAARLVGVLRAAEYGLGVAAARSAGSTRQRLVTTLDWVSTTRRSVADLAGKETPAVPLGYALPQPVTNDATALALGRTVLTGLTDDVLSGAPAAASRTDPLRALLHWATLAESHARALDAPLRAFPGLRPG